MNPKIKLWCEALESGEYAQGRLGLKIDSDNKQYFCCLGVACDLYLKEQGKTWEAGPIDRHYVSLPDFVVEWLGVDSRDPQLIDKKSCIYFNDALKLNFKEIAKLIREKYDNNASE